MIGISSLTIIDKKGKSLLSRNYREDIPSDFLHIFNKKILEHDAEQEPPLITTEDISFFYVKHANVRILASTKGNANSMLVFTFLSSFLELLKDFLKKVESEVIKDNIIVIYELMDEIMDNGYPQSTDFKILKKYIKTSAKLNFGNSKKKQKKKEREIVKGMVSAIPWRSGKYKYSKNEAYLDVIEKINMIITANGQVLKSEVEGTLHMKCKLSGTPELILGLNDKKFFDINKTSNTSKKTVDIQDIKFHQCVRLAKFENDRTISFIPPDGEFDLIKYRMNCAFKGLFDLNLNFDKFTKTKIEFSVFVKTKYKQRVTGNFVEFWIPLPQDAQNVKARPSMGNTKYLPDNNCLSWKIRSLQGKKELNLSIKLDMPSLSSDSVSFKNQPIQIFFDIPYYTLSGLNVRYLKIKDKSNYHALSWVRYIAKSGDFVIRTNKMVV